MIYTGTLLAPGCPWQSLLVPLVVLLFTIEHFVFGGLVTQARNKYGIPYPSMYAVPGSLRYYDPSMKPTKDDSFQERITNGEAYSFNLIQRGPITFEPLANLHHD